MFPVLYTRYPTLARPFSSTRRSGLPPLTPSVLDGFQCTVQTPRLGPSPTTGGHDSRGPDKPSVAGQEPGRARSDSQGRPETDGWSRLGQARHSGTRGRGRQTGGKAPNRAGDFGRSERGYPHLVFRSTVHTVVATRRRRPGSSGLCRSDPFPSSSRHGAGSRTRSTDG